jgi:hypothetical protein
MFNALVLLIQGESCSNPTDGFRASPVTPGKLIPQPVILGFRSDADKICALLGCYAASSDNPLPTFRDNVSFPSSRVKKSKEAVLL